MREYDATVLRWHAVRAQAIQKHFGVRPRDVVFGETAQIQDTHALADCDAFLANDVEHIVAAVAVIFLTTIERIPLGPLPAKGLGEYATFSLELFVQRARTLRTTGRQFFARQDRGVSHVVVLKCLGPCVIFIGKHAKPARIEARHINFRIAMQYPLCKILAAAGALRDAERCATA